MHVYERGPIHAKDHALSIALRIMIPNMLLFAPGRIAQRCGSREVVPIVMVVMWDLHDASHAIQAIP